MAEQEKANPIPSLEQWRGDPNDWLSMQRAYAENRRVLNLVRQEVHRYLAGAANRAREQHNWLTLLGVDAPQVFAAGGYVLAELRNAVSSLLAPGLASTAALQARTALMTIGRSLYKGPSLHTSPITGKTHEVKGEKNMLLALIDDLWEATKDKDRRTLLEQARVDAQEAYDDGSRAKNPLAISHQQAIKVVEQTYLVAKAICFAGGFPLDLGVGESD